MPLRLSAEARTRGSRTSKASVAVDPAPSPDTVPLFRRAVHPRSATSSRACSGHSTPAIARRRPGFPRANRSGTAGAWPRRLRWPVSGRHPHPPILAAGPKSMLRLPTETTQSPAAYPAGSERMSRSAGETPLTILCRTYRARAVRGGIAARRSQWPARTG